MIEDASIERSIEKFDARSTKLISIINFGVTEVKHGIHLIKNETQILLSMMSTGKKVSPNEINCEMDVQSICWVHFLAFELRRNSGTREAR